MTLLLTAALVVVLCFVTGTPRLVSAFEFDVHFLITLWLAEQAGFTEDEAFELAKYDQATDDAPQTAPLPITITPETSWAYVQTYFPRIKHHFPSEQELATFKRSAFGCVRGFSREQYREAGYFLHALEDITSHGDTPYEVLGIRWFLGHLVDGHSPDKPWQGKNRGAVPILIEGKFSELVALQRQCSRNAPVAEATAKSNFEPLLRVVRAWSIQETQRGVGARGGETRWNPLLQRLFGTRHRFYTENRRRDYDAWRQRQDADQWRQP